MNFYLSILHFFKNYYLRLKQKRQIKIFDITIFLRQFATLISAGIPIIKTCEILEKSQDKLALRILIYSIKRDILNGQHFFSSLQKYPIHFDALSCHLIQIGEHTGKLDTMLLKVANNYENRLIFKKKIKQALFYPLIISATAFLLFLSMFFFVIPRFAELFQDSQEKLPVLTIILFRLSQLLHQYIWILLAFWNASLMILFYYFKKNHHFFKTMMSKLPLVNLYLRKMQLAQFARNLALTFTAGISIIDALKLLSQNNNHVEFSMIIIKLRNKLSGGLQLHLAMESIHFFPVLMIQMIKIGEESGMLDDMLNKVADFLETEIEQFIQQLSQLLEPLIMLALGVLIGGLVISMYLPIFKLGTIL